MCVVKFVYGTQKLTAFPRSRPAPSRKQAHDWPPVIVKKYSHVIKIQGSIIVHMFTHFSLIYIIFAMFLLLSPGDFLF
jgi:hypothetical protein